MNDLDFSFRLALYGDPNVGKKTLLQSMSAKPISFNSLEYYIAETYQTNLENRKVILEIFPISQNKNMNRSIRYHAALVLYSMADTSSFKHLQQYFDEFEPIRCVGSQIFVIGTHSDLDSDNAKLPTLQYPQYEINAQDRSSIRHLTKDLTKILLTNYQEDYFKICKEITQELLEQPLFEPFRDPVDSSIAPDYRNIIKNPIDLSTIHKKLESNQYHSIEDWQKDIQLISKNCEQYNGAQDRLTKVAKEMIQVYEILLKKLPPVGMKKLSSELNSSIKKFNEQCDGAPIEMREMFPYGMAYTQSDLKLPFSGKDISHIIEGVEEINKSIDGSLQLNQITNEFDIKKIDNGEFTDIEIDNIFDDAKIYLRSYVNLQKRKK